MKNCVDIIRPFVQEAGQEGLDFQVIGGNGVAALVHPETEIVENERWVIAPRDLNLPQFRDDGNRRDLDVLLKTTSATTVAKAEAIGREIIGNELELSFFGLRSIAQLETQARHWLLSLAKVWVGDRYVLENNGRILIAKKALFPVAVNVDPATYETWQLFIGQADINPTPIPHPGQTIANYATRAIVGLRPKDADKVGKLADNVFAKTKEVRDWMVDGPGGSQIDMARILLSLHSNESLRLGESLSFAPYSGELSEDRAFMLPDAPAVVQSLVLAVSKQKANLDYYFESHPGFVTFWQRHIEGHIDKILKNQ